MTEIELIAWIQRRAGRGRNLLLGIGDDCAILQPKPGEDLLFTTDLFIEDVHFRHATHSAADCGHTALARGLSDIAAMGGEPRFCLMSLAVGADQDERWVKRFFDGLIATARRVKCQLAGGDLGHAAKTMADIIVCGAVPRGKALRRDGARAGDAICVTGALGAASLALARGRPLLPDPRLKEGAALRKSGATAAMDLSDGLSIDLHRLTKASGVAAMLDRDLPVCEGASLEQALHGGEDYELLFTMPGGARIPRRVAGTPVTHIGTIVKGKPGLVRVPGGVLRPLGYDHFRK